MIEDPDTDASDVSVAPGAVIGRFRVIRQIGAGGMGATFLATREDVDKRVCLKVILRQFAADPLYREQFLAEATAAARASHPNVVSLIDYGEHVTGELWAAYDLVDGADLLVLMKKLPKGLDADLVALIASDVAGGLLHLHTPDHRRGAIIHRDLSLNNVMVSYDGHAVIIDLGIAKVLLERGRAVTQPKGKLSYMAPEILRGEPIGPAVDQWALGVVLYSMLAGRPPFPGGYQGRPPPPLDSHAGRPLDPRWTPIVERLLSPEPSERYPSLAELMEELAPLVPPPTRRLQLGRLLRMRAPTPSALAHSPASGDATGEIEPAPKPAPAPAVAPPPPEAPAPSPARAPAAVASLQPGDAFGAWTIERKLGEGGMAVVYRAQRTSSLGSQTAALKLIRPVHAESEAFVERFIAEARTALRLNHQNIVTVLDAGEVEGVYYLAMELVEGCDLEMLLDRLTARGLLTGRRLPPRFVATIGYYLARGVTYAHKQGVIHRDLTTNNAMLTTDGAVKWTDWGVSKPMLADGFAKHTEHMVGKPYYMPPEQFRGDRVDARADLFSIGATLYELLAGAPPYAIRGNKREALEMLVFRVFHNDRPHVSEVAPDAPPELVSAIEQLLQPRPEDRLGSGEELIAALEPIVELRVTRQIAELVRAALDEQHAVSDATLEAARTSAVPQLAPRPPMPAALPQPTSAMEPGAVTGQDAPATERASSKWLLWGALTAAVVLLAGLSGAAAFMFSGATETGISSEDERAEGRGLEGIDEDLRDRERAAGESEASGGSVASEEEPSAIADEERAPEPPATAAPAAPPGEVADLEAQEEAEEEPTTTEAAAPSAPAFISVVVVPLGDVRLDGRPIPVRRAHRVAPGRHRIVATYAGQRRTRIVNVEPGQREQVVIRFD